MNMTALFGGLAVSGVALAALITRISLPLNPVIVRPANVPADFLVQREESGGMMPSGSSLVITPTEVRYEKYGSEETEQHLQFVPSPTEIESLYQALENQQFATIKTYTEKIYDRGGTTITYTAGNQTITKSDSGTSFVQEGESAARFYAIDDMLMDILAKHAQ